MFRREPTLLPDAAHGGSDKKTTRDDNSRNTRTPHKKPADSRTAMVRPSAGLLQ